MSRAERRQNREKKQARAKALGRSVKDAEHLATCSCISCGNKRKNEGKTLQEIRAEDIELPENPVCKICGLRWGRDCLLSAQDSICHDCEYWWGLRDSWLNKDTDW